MTTPAPVEPEPLLTKDRLAIWAQERPLLDPDFADLLIDAVSTLLRQYGDTDWTMATLPKRARDIGYIVTKNYYKNPDLLRSETTGPITETRAEAVLQGVALSEDQQAELGALANGGPVDTSGDIWTMSFGREYPLYAPRPARPNNLVMWDTRGGWPIEYLDESEAWVFQPEDPNAP